MSQPLHPFQFEGMMSLLPKGHPMAEAHVVYTSRNGDRKVGCGLAPLDIDTARKIAEAFAPFASKIGGAFGIEPLESRDVPPTA